jgi:tRNA-splicing ligase RtcB
MPDRELACVPLRSPEGQRYLQSMAAAANFAFANRQMIASGIRRVWRYEVGPQPVETVYDVAHNIAKVEDHIVDGRQRRLVVHRKGATRAFPGQPVLIPGSMGTASWILAGAEGAMRETFGSVCHGAGRLLSRTAARKGRDAREVQRKLESEGVLVRSDSRDGILEEIPEAYKNVDEVIEVVHQAGLARKVARLRPMGVIKG